MAKKGDVKEELRIAFDEADVHKKGYLTIPQTKVVLERILEFSLEDRLTNVRPDIPFSLFCFFFSKKIFSSVIVFIINLFAL